MPTVAQVIAQTLAAYGTEKFFCFMGGDHDLWYALHDAGIQIVNCRSEAGAVYMADGYGRVSGKPGFVYGQRGPGVANVAGAMADPVWASSPLISLTSAISATSRDRFEYQELDEDAGSDAIYREENHGTVNSRRIPPPAGAMRAAIDRLLAAQRPMILAGKGCVISEAWDELTRFADLLRRE